jgi:hypothetical protein
MLDKVRPAGDRRVEKRLDQWCLHRHALETSISTGPAVSQSVGSIHALLWLMMHHFANKVSGFGGGGLVRGLVDWKRYFPHAEYH